MKRSPRYIATVETSKHRLLYFLDESILPDNMLVNIAVDNSEFLSILSSQVHTSWTAAQGGTLGVVPRYNKTRCFETFPFPEIQNPDLKTRLTNLAEQVDAHRKARQAEHPDLTLTGMYNILEKLRSGEPLTDKDKVIHDQGLVTLLKQLHDDIDVAVLETYLRDGFQPFPPMLEKSLESSSTDTAKPPPIADRLAHPRSHPHHHHARIPRPDQPVETTPCRFKNQKSKVKNQKSKIKNQKSRFK
ncbi:MAG: hypothetical protein ACI9E1_000858 [Cryomorphaceae bacterium]|jgi:hypothetical protein